VENILQYDPSAAHTLLSETVLNEIEPQLTAAREEMFRDVEQLESGGEISAQKQPLDAGFIQLPRRLLDAHSAGSDSNLLSRIGDAADMLTSNTDAVVILGIGGSYMGARALFEALQDPYHNERNSIGRDGPRIYFQGNNLDNDALVSLLDLLEQHDENGGNPQPWGIVVISKSGGTLETAAAFRIFRDALEKQVGSDSYAPRQLIVPITGAQGRLRDLAQAYGYEFILPIPDNVGGRFSIFTAVGLLPAALMGLDIDRLLQGAADMTERFRSQPCGENPVMDYAATCHLLECRHGMTTRVLSTWGSRLEAVGLWYDQLLAESLGKQERGATPLTVVNTRDLHSRGQQHQEGTRDKLITNLFVGSPSTDPLAVPTADDDADNLNRLQGKTFPDLLAAAFSGTNRAYADDRRPTADILLPRLDEYALGQLLQMFMLATVLEGRLIGINPYGQPGVEAYKRNMNEILDQ